MSNISRALVKIAILSATLSSPSAAQNANTGPEFEVASVKQAPPRVPFSVALGLIHNRMDDLRFESSSITMTSLISLAYGLKADRISGPGWMSEQYFAITAKLPDGSTKEKIPAMLQKLLADRFKLSLHRDPKEEPVFELVADKKRAKLKPSAAGASGDGCSSWPGRCFCGVVTLSQLADFLTGMGKRGARMEAMPQPGELVEHRIDRPVIDQTGLTGVYDIDLQWVPPAGLPSGLNSGAADFPPRDPATKANSIFGALEAVGLKLQAARHAFDILVIDHVERLPSEN